MTKTTREIEQRRNINVFGGAIIISIIVSIFIFILMTEIPNMILANYPNSSQPTELQFRISEPTMIIYPNGSYWIKNGTEQYDGEQLAKVMISYSSYIRGYCEGLK